MQKKLETGLLSESPEATKECAALLAASMTFQGTIALCGDLGAGKTVFAKGLAEAVGVASLVKSPSYNVCLSYEGKKANFVHIDAYRLKSPADFDGLLIDEIVPDPKLVCIEWPGVIAQALTANTKWIKIEILPDLQTRKISLMSAAEISAATK